MENKNTKNGLIICILSIIIIILLILVILFATNKISLNLSNNPTNNGESNSNENNNENNPIVNNNTTNNDGADDENKYDRTTLEGILKFLGITKSNNYSMACLNISITQEEKITSLTNIVSYSSDAFGNLLTSPPDNVYSSLECGMGAADCYSISKEKAQIFFEFYNLAGEITDYFQYSTNLKDDYIFWYGHYMGMCSYEVEHDIDTKQTDASITITDKQIVKEYNDDYEHAEIKNTTNRIVTYNLNKDKNGNYYLNSVEIK